MVHSLQTELSHYSHLLLEWYIHYTHRSPILHSPCQSGAFITHTALSLFTPPARVIHSLHTQLSHYSHLLLEWYIHYTHHCPTIHTPHWSGTFITDTASHYSLPLPEWYIHYTHSSSLFTPPTMVVCSLQPVIYHLESTLYIRFHSGCYTFYLWFFYLFSRKFRSLGIRSNKTQTFVSKLVTAPEVRLARSWFLQFWSCRFGECHVCRSRSNRTGHGTTDWFQLGKEYVKAVYCHPAYLP